MKKRGEKSQRQKKIQELIRQLASDFIAGETNATSLITVTEVDISPDLATCDILFTVFPDDSTESALNFSGCRHYGGIRIEQERFVDHSHF